MFAQKRLQKVSRPKSLEGSTTDMALLTGTCKGNRSHHPKGFQLRGLSGLDSTIPSPRHIARLRRQPERMANGHPRSRLESPLPRPNIPSPLPLLQQLSNRGSRSHLHLSIIPTATHSNPSTHLQQWDNMLGFARQPGLESGAECGERDDEHPKHVDGQFEE